MTRLSPLAWVVLTLIVLLWIVGAYQTRSIDSDTGRPVSVGSGVNEAPVHTSKRTHDAVTSSEVWLRPSPTPTRASRGHRTRLLDVTAYCYTGNHTASGVWPREGQAASNKHPFGTRLRVPGWGLVEVTDRIGWGSDLDLYMNSCAAARAWGRRHLRVEVLR